MQEEKYGFLRSRVYSAWHRRHSARRFVGIEAAQRLCMVDIDASLWVEVDDHTKEPLALIETSCDVGQAWKAAGVTKRLAQRAGVPAYVVLYRCSAESNPASPGVPDIASFRVKRLWPKPEHNWRHFTPTEYAKGLLRIREWACKRLDREAANDANYESPTPTSAALK